MKFSRKSIKQKVAAGLAVGSVITTNASAALAATDVDMASASDDVTLVFKAILGIAVLIFGFKAVKRFLG
jgi:hypothetical protein